MLSNPENVSRIRSADEYREGIDLDIYAPAFADVGLSAKFAGTDIDGIFGTIGWQDAHGMWERDGHILIQEHKRSMPRSYESSGQFQALAALARVNPKLLFVIVTVGPFDSPAGQQWHHILAGGVLGQPSLCTEDVETWPHRRWIRMVNRKRVEARKITRAL